MMIVGALVFGLYLYIAFTYKKDKVLVLLANFICLAVQITFLLNMFINKARTEEIKEGKFVIYKVPKQNSDKSVWVFRDKYSILFTIPGDKELDDFLKSKVI